MRSRRHQVSLAVAAALVLAPATARADAPFQLGKVDFFTLELHAGAIGTPDSPPPALPAPASAEVAAGLIGARAELLGLGAHAATFRVAARPSLETASLSGTLGALDFWMVGARYPDVDHCFALVSGLCDSDTGYVGFGGTVLDMAGDLATRRLGMRFVEGDFVASVTPAFDGDWKHYRFLPKLGASVDMIADLGPDTHEVVGRMMVGFDALATAGPIELRPTFRWRPSFTAFVDDFAIEATLRATWRTAWEAWHDRDALTVGMELGYSFDRDPSTAFGADRIVGAQNALFARLVIEPTIFTFGPP
jgi:hypothetical protein